MISVMPHRGPDARGVTQPDAWVCLGHMRLAILDLRPESNQPFVSDDGDLVLTYNGEVYNYLELREELERLGHVFRTDSDTEVVLKAYQQWGPAALQRFNGMWAPIYDRRTRSLFCARDRFGVKPFVYATSRGHFIFASEIKAILAAAPELAEPNYEALSRVLRVSLGAVCASTAFKDIFRLPPAHYLTVQDGQIKIERWWDFPTTCDRSLSYDDAAEKLREILQSAVKLRLRSDVPVGITLSSGLDSSSIAALVRLHTDAPFDTYTARYNGEACDESPFAQQFATSLHMTPHLVAGKPDDFLDTLRQVIWHLEMPNSNPAVFPLWKIAETARQQVKVLLEGQGADESLAGYKPNYVVATIELALSGQFAAAAREFAWACKSLGTKQACLLAGRYIDPPALHKIFRFFRGDERVYVGELRNASAKPERRRPINNALGRLNSSLVNQFEGSLVNLLHYGDAISMAHSIESRCPFMDYRLVEFAMRLPGEYKYRDGYGKAVLRQAMRGVVPKEILETRAKLGFPSPIARWFRESPETTIDPVLRSPECRRRGIFDPNMLDQAIQRHLSGKVDLSNTIYRWITTELWYQMFIDRTAAKTTNEPASFGSTDPNQQLQLSDA